MKSALEELKAALAIPPSHDTNRPSSGGPSYDNEGKLVGISDSFPSTPKPRELRDEDE